jgi:hypothetical protein
VIADSHGFRATSSEQFNLTQFMDQTIIGTFCTMVVITCEPS